MQRGDRTIHGTYLGEELVDRHPPLSVEEARAVVAKLEAGGFAIAFTKSHIYNDFTTDEEARAGTIEFFREHVIAQVFEDAEGNRVYRQAELGDVEVLEPAPEESAEPISEENTAPPIVWVES
jgi:hypothetical protein